MKNKIGILGSSHSYGGNHVGSDKTSFLIDSLKKEMPDYDFVTTAYPGLGSERFLHCLTYLKTQHNIKYVLIENVEDRKWKTVHFSNEDAEAIEQSLKTQPIMTDKQLESMLLDYKIIYTQTYKDKSERKNSILRGIPKGKLEAWKNVCYVLYRSTYSKVEGVYNVAMTEKLCNQLGIIPIHWSFENYPGRQSSHPTIKNCKQYFEDLNEHYIGSDGSHLSQTAQDKIVKEYLTPIIHEAVKMGDK